MSQQSTAARSADGFEAIVSSRAIQPALTVLDALVQECVIEFGEDGIHAVAVDPATVGFVELELGTGAFESYDASGEVLGIDLDRLMAVFGMQDGDAPVHLRLDAETRRLHVEADGLSYDLALIDPDAIRDAPARSDLDSDFTASATLSGGDLERAVRAAGMVSDHLAVGAEDDGMYVSAEGDTDDVRLELDDDELDEFSPGDAHSLFSIDYLSDMVAAIPDDADVEMRFGEETILELAFDVVDGGGEVVYLLSPRMQV